MEDFEKRRIQSQMHRVLLSFVTPALLALEQSLPGRLQT